MMLSWIIILLVFFPWTCDSCKIWCVKQGIVTSGCHVDTTSSVNSCRVKQNVCSRTVFMIFPHPVVQLIDVSQCERLKKVELAKNGLVECGLFRLSHYQKIQIINSTGDSIPCAGDVRATDRDTNHTTNSPRVASPQSTNDRLVGDTTPPTVDSPNTTASPQSTNGRLVGDTTAPPTVDSPNTTASRQSTNGRLVIDTITPPKVDSPNTTTSPQSTNGRLVENTTTDSSNTNASPQSTNGRLVGDTTGHSPNTTASPQTTNGQPVENATAESLMMSDHSPGVWIWLTIILSVIVLLGAAAVLGGWILRKLRSARRMRGESAIPLHGIEVSHDVAETSFTSSGSPGSHEEGGARAQQQPSKEEWPPVAIPEDDGEEWPPVAIPEDDGEEWPPVAIEVGSPIAARTRSRKNC